MVTMYERIKNMSLEEMKDFIYWVYKCGNEDGFNGGSDTESGYFGGYMLGLPVTEVMKNNSTDDLWELFNLVYRKKGE